MFLFNNIGNLNIIFVMMTSSGVHSHREFYHRIVFKIHCKRYTRLDNRMQHIVREKYGIIIVHIIINMLLRS